MKHGEFNDKEQLIIAGLDFDRYTDPVAKSIGNWHNACDHWNNRLRIVFRGDANIEQASADTKLANYEAAYIDSFSQAANQITADSLIEENAVDALYSIIREDESRRLSLISKWYDGDPPKLSSDEYFRDIVMPFADPEGKTIIGISNEPIVSQEVAIEMYRARVNEQARMILQQKHFSMTERTSTQRRETRTFILSLGAIATGAFWAITRGKRHKR